MEDETEMLSAAREARDQYLDPEAGRFREQGEAEWEVLRCPATAVAEADPAERMRMVQVAQHPAAQVVRLHQAVVEAGRRRVAAPADAPQLAGAEPADRERAVRDQADAQAPEAVERAADQELAAPAPGDLELAARRPPS